MTLESLRVSGALEVISGYITVESEGSGVISGCIADALVGSGVISGSTVCA